MDELSVAVEAADRIGPTNVVLIVLALALLLHTVRQARSAQDTRPSAPQDCGLNETLIRLIIRDELRDFKDDILDQIRRSGG